MERCGAKKATISGAGRRGARSKNTNRVKWVVSRESAWGVRLRRINKKNFTRVRVKFKTRRERESTLIFNILYTKHLSRQQCPPVALWLQIVFNRVCLFQEISTVFGCTAKFDNAIELFKKRLTLRAGIPNPTAISLVLAPSLFLTKSNTSFTLPKPLE